MDSIAKLTRQQVLPCLSSLKRVRPQTRASASMAFGRPPFTVSRFSLACKIRPRGGAFDILTLNPPVEMLSRSPSAFKTSPLASQVALKAAHDTENRFAARWDKAAACRMLLFVPEFPFGMFIPFWFLRRGLPREPALTRQAGNC